LLPSDQAVAAASREGRATSLARWLERCVADAPRPAGEVA
jgi:hypothetical protein